MTDARADDAFIELTIRYLDDLLEPGELVVLEKQLQSDPAQRRLFQELCRQSEALRSLLEPDQAATAVDVVITLATASAPPTPWRPVRRFRWQRWGLGVVACAALCLIVVSFRGGVPIPTQSKPEASQLVAEVMGARGAAGEDGVDFAEGAQLAAGKLNLASGILQLRMATGAVMLLEAPAELDLVEPAKAFLHFGKLVVQVPNPVAQIEVGTPDARMKDRGTEFGIAVDGDSGTTLYVFDGAVETVQVAAPETARLVSSGEAVRILENLPVQNVPFAPNRFIRVFPIKPYRGNLPANRPCFDACNVVPAPGPVVIDGDLSDWDRSGEFHSKCEKPFDTTYQARSNLMYDDHYLYIAAEVSDPFPMRSLIDPSTDARVGWRGGGVRLRLSTDPKLGWPIHAYDQIHHSRRPLRPLDADSHLVHILMWYYQAAEKPCLRLTYGMTAHSERINPEGFQGVFRKHADGKGYTLEYAIPWELLGVGPGESPPKGGDMTAACWTVHWAEEDGRVWTGQLVDVLNPEISGWTYMRSATWGKAIWHDKGNLPPGTVRPVEFPEVRAYPPN